MADGEAEKELTAKQRKNRKKKEAAKRKKQEQKLQVSPLAYTSKFLQNLSKKVCVSWHIFQESVKVSAENTLENDGDKTQQAGQVKRFKPSRLATGQRSFSYRGAKLWNNLSNDLKNVNSVKAFKSKLTKQLLLN